ncbi:hypothetical protein BV22DRAFT_1101415 [Leucogyrophana mollusca]|uniref:Uncharacterized protein n=1 Tax=Leucogyrophana mollusca TaxID=85980 RepID=A0ACB8BZC4_9AGAM|nr:hypothetical protein BV22DRAFT_1101415 [Leucogyrophana mollusca]
MSTPERQELVRNAVSFLSDFSTQQAPLAQRIQFLEAKGLTGPEIEDALKQASNATSASQSVQRPLASYQAPYSQAYGPSPYPGMPPPLQWDWRDYFITAVISGTVAYGAASLFKKFLLPHLRPPTATAYEQDRDALTAQFDAAEALLKEIQAETAAVRAAVEEQKERVDKTTADVESVVAEMREGEVKARDEMREIREEVANIREMLPKMIEKNKETQKQSLAELQQELKSLKALLLSRNSGPLSSSPSTPAPSLAGRPSIPAWQLAGSAPATPSAPDPIPTRPGAFTPPFCATSASPIAGSLATQRSGSPAPSPQRSGSPGPQRTGSPGPRSGSPNPSSLPKSGSLPEAGLRKTTLEERLRASFTVGEASGGSTPNMSSRASPVPVPVAQHPLSPTSTPLPESPTLSPAIVASSPPNSPPIASPPRTPVVPSFAVAVEEISKEVPELPVDLAPGAESSSDDTNASLPSSTVTEAPVDSITTESSPEESTNTTGDPLEKDNTTEGSAAGGEVNDQSTSNAEVESATPPATGDPHPAEPPISPHTEHSPVAQDSILVESGPAIEAANGDNDLESMQQRLKLVEQRFTDVSISFKRLQAERLVADSIFRELTPLEDTKDVDALRDYLSNMNMKTELTQDELQRLSGKLTRQEERIEELRDTHRLESSSQSAQIEKLRKQLDEAEALLAASQSSTSHSEEEMTKRNAEIDRLHGEMTKVKESAKEEEEKRVKAISLLKTVRQKLVKAEKDRDDASRELTEMKEKEKQEREKEKAERSRLQIEIDAANTEREKAIVGLRAQFDKELAVVKDRAEKELFALRGQLELEIATLKSSHSSELSSKNSHISTLENSVNNLSKENKTYFEQLQIRQAELESSQYHSESLQSQTTELQFQLREAQDRVAVLTDEISDLRREQDMRSQGPAASTEGLPQLLLETEAKYEAKLAELRRDLAVVEKGRTESEADWSRKLLDKARETDELKRVLQSSAKTREEGEGAVNALKAEISRLKAEGQTYQRRNTEMQAQLEQMKDAESSAARRVSDVKTQVDTVSKQLEESKGREMQLRSHNKTLRDELRKVQSSAALLERQRNPGVGYWMARHENTDSRTSISSDPPSRGASPGPSSPAPSKGDEEINLEYLRNVILQFLEHKEMRPNLVRVLSIILRFTPQETRRLIAKV